MKLTYWKCDCLDGDNALSIREKSKKAAKAQRKYRGEELYGEPHLVEVEYSSGFDLLKRALGEGGGYL